MHNQSVIILLGCLILTTFLVFFIVFIIQFARRIHKNKIEKINQQQEQLRISVLAMESERSRIGRDIHDDIAPLLMALQFENDGIALNHSLPSETIKSQQEIVGKLHSSIRVLSRSLYPFSLKEFGLLKAIGDHKFILEKASNVFIRLDVKTPLDGLEFETQLAVYRIFQEFCNNSLKHSSCSEILFSAIKEKGVITICLSDNGKGFVSGSALVEGLGLKNMRMRAEVAGFKYQIKSEIDKGVLIKLIM